jgi:hypothetical protein
MSEFTWIPFYKELANKLLMYRDRQDELIDILKKLKNQELPVIRLIDKDKKGKEVPLKEIDPFTFFSSFNRGSTDQNRRAILTSIKQQLQLQAEVPADFDGIPIMDPRKSWFYDWESERKADDIPALWAFAEAIVRRAAENLDPRLFDRCLKVSSTSVTNLTMGMYWMQPETYLALDRRNRALLDVRGVEHKVNDWASYVQFLKAARQSVPEMPYEFSYEAYAGRLDVKYWVFQSNPHHYDVVGALRDGAVKTWQTNQHKKDIHPNDRVIIWATGEAAGCYALATVTSEVHAVTEDPMEAAYRKQPIENRAVDGITLRIDTNLWDTPVLKETIIGQPEFHDFPAGRQGTNLAATKAHYEGILALVRGRTEMRYWLYAPGRDAKYWDECWQKGIMLYGADEISDLSAFANKAAIEKAFKAAKQLKRRPTNDARGAWEFSHVLSPGDIVIAKKGTRQFVGYGVVSGPYRYEPERMTYRNIRPVRWVKKGIWEKKMGGPIVQKALTDITKYPEYVQELRKLIGIEDTNPGNGVSLALNTILYGPPGTGKTYTLRNEYMIKRFTERVAVVSRDDFAAELVADLAWWQVITMVMLDLKTSNVSGILAHPLMQARIRRANNQTPRAAVWAHLQIHTKTDCAEVKYSKRYEPLLFSKDANSVWSIDIKLAAEEAADLVEALERYRGYAPDQGGVIKRYEFTTFHQSYSYEDFVEGIKPVMSEEAAETIAYEVKAGIFKTMVKRAMADPSHDYALLIDEINRGNVASIFGELITLIEEDKRLGAPNELRARLPYSREEFVVPRNLYIIGAMNTADRSVEALDTALRRRFTFIAISPQPERIQQPVNLDVDLQKLLGVINARIEKLLDKDHCIGHSYFMDIAKSNDSIAELRNVFSTKILPLMEEYFYGDPAKIGMVLGERFVSRKDDAIEWAKGDWGMDELEEYHVYALRDPMTLNDEDFRAVYE